MPDRLSDKLTEYLSTAQGKRVGLRDIREFLKIEPGSNDDQNLRKLMSGSMVERKIVSPSGYNDGFYKVIRRVQPVRVFIPGRERRPIFNLKWPEDRDRGVEIDIADRIVVREGDLITLGGVKNKGKTTLCLNFTAANIDISPALMGNEYTVFNEGIYEPAPRFLHRLDVMSDWVSWTNGDGYDKFTLWPVKEDYAENIVKDRINIIDWINLDGDKSYDIGKILEGIKASLGRGVAIVAIQKGEGAVNPRGGQFVRDFSDVEILLDGYGSGDNDIMLTVKECKEKTKPIAGKTYAYSIVNEGTEIWNFREVVKCNVCYGKGWKKSGNTSVPCDACNRIGKVDK